MRASSTSSRSSRWLPPMISPMPGREHVHRRDRPVVVVQPHVERLDVLRVVHDDHRLADVPLGEVALVLRLQVDAPLAPGTRTSPSRARGSRSPRCSPCARTPNRRCACSFAITPFSMRSSKNAMSSGRSASSVVKMCLRSASARSRVVGEVGEGDLGLDHPELGEVPARVRVLGAERRAEGVDLREREAVALDVELARHREVGLAPEEVLREVDLRRRACAGGSRGRASTRGRARRRPRRPTT